MYLRIETIRQANDNWIWERSSRGDREGSRFKTKNQTERQSNKQMKIKYGSVAQFG